MSVTAASQQSNIWASATSALTNTPSSKSLGPSKPNEAGGPAVQAPKAGLARANPFQSLSNDTQSALIQMQAAQSQVHA